MAILIVDDSEDARYLLETFLKGAGYQDITAVGSAREAFNILGMTGAEPRRPVPFKAILMDVVMPEMDGIEACRAIKEDPRLADIPVIMVTAVGGGQEHLDLAFKSGATDYIAKPVNKMELLARVRTALKLHGEMERRKAHERELTETLKHLQSAQTELVRSQKLASIGVLSAGVAHEILNPLNIIGTTAQLVMMDAPEGELREKMRTVMEQIQRAVKIVRILGTFAGKSRMEVEDVHLSSCFEQVAGAFGDDLRTGNIAIVRHFAPGAPPVRGNAAQLEQVFAIFLSNAIDAMRPRGHGTITVGTRMADGGIELKFFDDGPGIPADIQEKVFDPFFTTKDPGKGTGLGLAIVHHIIEDHGGTISLESGAGNGACFTIFLPKDGARADTA